MFYVSNLTTSCSYTNAKDRVPHFFGPHCSLFQALGQWGLSNAAGRGATSRVW